MTAIAKSTVEKADTISHTLESRAVPELAQDRPSGERTRSRIQRRTITLALPSGMTPLDSEEGLRFLSGRLAMFSVVVCALGVFALLATQLLKLGLPDYEFPRTFLTEGGLQHSVAFGISLAIFAIARNYKYGLLGLLTLDAAGTLLSLSAYAAMCLSNMRMPQRTDITMMLITLSVLTLRAVVIPSSWAHTLCVGVLASLPALVLTYLNAPRVAALGLPFPTWIALGYMGVWTVLGLSISTLASHVIYGLRCQIAQVRQLGQYVLESKIGEGGMGVVYKARHSLLRRPTAIKVVLPERVGEQVLRRFEREVQLTARLTHPNTVSIYDYGKSPDGNFYYAMEYLDGVDLEQLVSRFGPLPTARVIHVLKQVAASLAEAHGVGLVHRDIKPANIILCERGGNADVAKVVDFGLVKDVQGLGRNKSASLSTVHAVVGTPLYMAPESLVNPERVDARADLYALGAVGYYLLTGLPLFQGASLVEVAAKHLHERPVAPSERTTLPIARDLESIVLRCLEKDSAKRPASAQELLSQLEACESDTWTADLAHEWWNENGERARAGRQQELADDTNHQHATLCVDFAARC
ncbi:MAG TPA: serine/threonine-protein kinase [Polyangiaceae bacterium]|nr:serine/threonine-protein kinase [Polyangiaceae bacterium]